MTVPTGPEPSSSEEGHQAGEPAVRPSKAAVLRRRRVLLGGLCGLGLVVVLLVVFVPALAAPLGTAAAVVAVAAPLIHRDTRPPTEGGSADGS